MRRTKWARTAATVLTVPLFAVSAAGPVRAADPAPAGDGDRLPYSTLALTALDCLPGGPSSSDNALAAAITDQIENTRMGGRINGYQMSCARAIVDKVRADGLNKRAAVIAITTVMAESTLHNWDGGDRDSVGLFQQRGNWGTVAERLDPAHATHSFLVTMQRVAPNWETDPIGAVCQEVQVSAIPGAYTVEIHNAQVVVDVLWGPRGHDFSGDGKSDLMVLNAAGQLSVRINKDTYFNGDIYPDPISQGWQTYLGGNGQGRLSFADFNADGKNDLIVQTPSGDIQVRINQGDHFDGGTVRSQGWQAYLGDPGQGELSFADFNADGRADMIIRKTDGSIMVRTNTGNAWTDAAYPNPVSQGWQAYLGDPGQGRLSFADFNADGRADMIIQKADGSIMVRTNTGNVWTDAAYPDPVSQGWQAYLGDPGQGKIYFADFNGDSRTDLFYLTTAGQLWVRTNKGNVWTATGHPDPISQGWQAYLGDPGHARLYLN